MQAKPFLGDGNICRQGDNLSFAFIFSSTLHHSLQGIMKTTLSIIILLAGLTSAQFQFFEQFFNPGQQAQGTQQKQNVPSDSNWFRQNWEGGK